MKNIEKLLNENSIYYKDLEYYFEIIKSTRVHLHDNPDISIESCKALIEGISKFILSSLDKAYNDKEVSAKEFREVTNLALKKLAEYDEKIDDRNFISQTLKFVKTLGEVRNARGDISHGKVSPKVESSSPQLAKFVFEMTKAILEYILSIFFEILQNLHDEEIAYEDNTSFNDWLDETHIMEGKLLYSKALFEQDYIAYCDQLESFLEDYGD